MATARAPRTVSGWVLRPAATTDAGSDAAYGHMIAAPVPRNAMFSTASARCHSTTSSGGRVAHTGSPRSRSRRPCRAVSQASLRQSDSVRDGCSYQAAASVNSTPPGGGAERVAQQRLPGGPAHREDAVARVDARAQERDGAAEELLHPVEGQQQVREGVARGGARRGCGHGVTDCAWRTDPTSVGRPSPTCRGFLFTYLGGLRGVPTGTRAGARP
ncbi:hypothetical protein LUX32_38805 [Actinomadura madurae]|nr:hypothetical protein [Actinomadura madurae]MCP9982919.1 hypothetical protein [Actinomadura madurae]